MPCFDIIFNQGCAKCNELTEEDFRRARSKTICIFAIFFTFFEPLSDDFCNKLTNQDNGPLSSKKSKLYAQFKRFLAFTSIKRPFRLNTSKMHIREHFSSKN